MADSDPIPEKATVDISAAVPAAELDTYEPLEPLPQDQQQQKQRQAKKTSPLSPRRGVASPEEEEEEGGEGEEEYGDEDTLMQLISGDENVRTADEETVDTATFSKNKRNDAQGRRRWRMLEVREKVL